MRLTVLGSNGTYPTPERPASGYLITAGDTSLVLDLGPGTFPALLGTGRFPDAIVLSHGHVDHCADLLSLFNYLRFDATDSWGVPVYAPDGVMDRLAAFAGAGDDHPFHTALPHHRIAPGDVVTVGPFTLRFGGAVHPVPAVVTRVEWGRHALTYSGDTGPGGDLPDLAAGCDLLVCEATHQGAPGPDRYPYHLHAAEAGAVAREAAVHALLITHVAPSLDPAVSVAEAAAVYPGPVRHAEAGLELGL